MSAHSGGVKTRWLGAAHSLVGSESAVQVPMGTAGSLTVKLQCEPTGVSISVARFTKSDCFEGCCCCCCCCCAWRCGPISLVW